MQLIPAIDLRGGRCVRLHQGDYGQETVYGDDPVAVAKGFEAAGARWIHVVDLDAARGQGSNRGLVTAVASDNVWATQFHPEKSGPAGLGLLANFAAACRG